MTTTETTPRPRTSWLTIVLLLAIAAGGGYLGAQMLGEMRRSSRAVLRSMREVRRLETVTFHMEKVVDLQDRQSKMFGLLEAEDAILFVAVGEVTAGLDLGDLRPEDVRIAAGRVSLRLPEPIILSSRLDNEHSYVHSRRTGLLAKRHESLEAQARQTAEREIVRAALAAGILDHARASAERQVRAILSGAGAKNVAIVWGE